MPYGFNNDKSKEEVYSKSEVYSKEEVYDKSEVYSKAEMDTWTQLPITNTTYFSGVVKYKKIGNEVTIKLNVDFIRGSGSGYDLPIINALPNEIRPVGGGADMGAIVQSPAYFTNMRHLVSFRIAAGLSIYFGAVTPENDYIHTEIKYNVKTTP